MWNSYAVQLQKILLIIFIFPKQAGNAFSHFKPDHGQTCNIALVGKHASLVYSTYRYFLCTSTFPSDFPVTENLKTSYNKYGQFNNSSLKNNGYQVELGIHEVLLYLGTIDIDSLKRDSPFGQNLSKMFLPSMDEVTWSYIVLVLALVPWLCYLLVGTFFIMGIVYGRTKLYKKSDPSPLLGELPGVSVIKPLMGVDPLLEINLESHFLMKYPKFELLLCVQDDQDPAISLVNQMKERYPKVDCTLFIGGKDGIINPMVNNMAPAYESAKYDLIWVSTSRIKASTDILLDMVGKMLSRPNCALVHQMPFTTDQKGLAAAVEKVYFGSSVARYYLSFHMLGIACFTGMSYLIKKSELDDLHGLSWFGKFLAEDFFIAKLLHEKGFRHQVAAVPAQQNVAATSIAAYKDRMVRWLRLRMNMMPFTAAILEPLSESIPLGLYMSWSMHYFFGINPYMYFFIHWGVWCILDYIQLRGVQNGSPPFNKLTYLVAWLIRELLFVFVYFEAVINVRRIKWGKRTYCLSNFGQSLEIVTDKSILPI